jgi:ABC-type multidrug transport system fused ATPase/permease subunit
LKNIKKILDLLTTSEKKDAIWLFFLILIMAFLDMLGVASILPFISMLANPQLLETNIFLIKLFEITKNFGILNVKQFIFALGVLVFILLIASLSFRILTTYVQVRFTLMREYSIGRRLLENYLHQPYGWFLNKHSSKLGKNILSEINEVIYQTIVPFMNLVSQGAVSIALIILLILTDPTLAMSISIVLAASYGIIFFLMKNFLSRIGVDRLKNNEKRFSVIQEAFGAFKEMKVGGLEQIYINQFSEPAKAYAKNQSMAQLITQLPRFFLECVAFGGMILLILYLINDDKEFLNIIPILSLYAYAGYRLMPALQQVYSALTQIRFSKPALDSLHKDYINLKYLNIKTNKITRIPLTKSIKLNNIFFNYPNSEKKSLNNINITIPALKKIGIIGPTGSGKTTLIDLILGLLDANSGNLQIDGKNITYENKRMWQKNIGYVPQQIYLSDASIESNIAFGLDNNDIDKKSIERASKVANLHEFVINELPDGYNTIVGERGVRLSGGQRQRIGIARALYHDPMLLLLDEATSALDNHTEELVMNSINKLKNRITIIVVAHRLSTVKNCDIVFLLEKGSIKAQGSFDEIYQNN